MLDKNSANSIEYIRAGSFDIPNLETLVLELWVDDLAVGSVYFADGAWQVKLAAVGGIVTIKWKEFRDFFHTFEQFMIDESEALIKENKKRQEDGE